MPNYENMTSDELIAEYGRFKEQLDDVQRRREKQVTLHRLSAEDEAKEAAITQELQKLDRWKMRAKSKELLLLQMENIAGARQVEKLKAGSQIVDTWDLGFMIAESLQRIYSSENPTTEYHDWVYAQQRIETEMKVDGTSAEELAARDAFVGFLDDRETEMKLVMSLYANTAIHGKGYYKEQAVQQLEFMRFKLSELRRLRTRMKNAEVVEQTAEKERQLQQEKRIREIQEALTAGVITAAAAHELTKGERYMMNKAGLAARDYEDDVANQLIAVRPETKSRTEAERRVEILKRNRKSMRMMLTKMRFGQSLQEQEEEAENEALRVELPVREWQGFRASRFRNVNSRESA